MISIGCPIYRSPRMAAFVETSLRKHTPHLGDGRAEFYFVANEPAPALVQYFGSLNTKVYNVSTPLLSDGQLRERGLAEPWYMRSIYRACNAVLSNASGDTCVLISSDMAFSPGWLEALLAEQDGSKLVTSQLIEPHAGIANVEAGPYLRDCGTSLATFSEEKFLAEAQLLAKPGTRPGGQYVPLCVPMKLWHECGGYPEGNIGDGSKYGVPGDVSLHARYARLGVPHVTALSSIVYHLVNGEMREDIS